ncbi:MAG TPA: hypothetical protein DCY49_00810, partial [Candidatus Jacksonbacteria bacterium]|nr:hypothetical protein [Candidatus Jacksonbacteria bacterium]
FGPAVRKNRWEFPVGGQKKGVGGEFLPPSPASSVRIFSNRHRTIEGILCNSRINAFVYSYGE